MWYLDLSWHRSLSWHTRVSWYSSSSCYFGLAYLSCHHTYVHLSSSCQLTLLVYILIVDRAYQSLWLTPFCFASCLPFPPRLQGGNAIVSLDFFCLKVIMHDLDFSWLWLPYCFIWGIIYEKVLCFFIIARQVLMYSDVKGFRPYFIR